MKWNIKDKYNEKSEFIDILLEGRGITGDEEKARFLNPPPIFNMLKEMSDDFKDSAKEAVSKIESTIKEEVPIVIHGDYDADGICAVAILSRVLRNELGYEKAFSFIPNRFDHGYGLSKSSVDESWGKLEEKFENIEKALLITVDSGITSVNEVEYAKSRGFDVIITDHHQKPDVLPDTETIVWNDQVVGAGIAWILAKLLKSSDRRLLGLAALATVTDLQPLFNYNRSIVKEGLEVLNKDPLPGIKALQQIAGRSDEKITTYDLGWVLGPRINASGRINDAEVALALLLEDGFDKAVEFAKSLNQINIERQQTTTEMYEMVTEISSDDLPKIIVSTNENYHEGIIGLVASKLVEKHYRPSIVISLNDDMAKGSVRSISGVNIIEFLRKFEDLFESVGGHPMAAGFTIKREKIETFREKVSEYANEYIDDEHLKPVLDVDLQIPIEIVDVKFLKILEKLKPFGIGNRSPVFASRNLGITNINLVGRGESHLSLELIDTDSGKKYRAIYFGGGWLADQIFLGDRVDIAYQAKENNYRGRTYVNLVLKDIKKI